MSKRDFFKKTQQRTYRSRSYKNPHLNERKVIPWRFLVILFLFVGLLMFSMVFFLRNNIFSLQTVEIRGVHFTDTTELEKAITDYLQEPVFFFFSRSHTFLFSEKTLHEILLAQFALEKLEIRKEKKILFLSLEERTSQFIWETGQKNYFADLEGMIVREQNAHEPFDSNLPYFIDKNNIPVHIGSQVLKKEEIEKTLSFLEYLTQQDIVYTSVEMNRLAGKWTQVMTLQGFGILFDAQGDIENQLKNLQIILERQKDHLDSLEYIDLRFGDKVYFK